MSLYSGDPALTLGPDGADLQFKGGQPVMDQGLHNAALISLFTTPGWIGNTLLQEDRHQIGSRFTELKDAPITLSSLDTARQSARDALNIPAFNEVKVNVQNIAAGKIQLTVAPPTDEGSLLITRTTGNWISQRESPVNRRLS